MSAVTTWSLLPSVHAPLEGERVLLLTGAVAAVLAPIGFISDIPAWNVVLRDWNRSAVYVGATKVQGYWREIRQ